MAGSQGSALAIAVSNAGGLGSQPCAMLGPDQIRNELQAITSATSKPYNVNFFVHKPADADPAREDAWRKLLAPYFADTGSIRRRSRPDRNACRSMMRPPTCSKSSSRRLSAFISDCRRMH